jgi:C-terminal processing protease CtpA/Prc
VTKLVPGGAAERSGELRVGDLILRVDGVDTEGLSSKVGV